MVRLQLGAERFLVAAGGEMTATARPSPYAILTRLADGTGVLLQLGTKLYFAAKEG